MYFRSWALPLTCILFLFSGLYKGIFQSPIDLTLLFGLILVVFVIAEYWSEKFYISNWILIYVALELYLFVRLFPGISHEGLRRLADATVFGIPAILAGVAIGRDERKQDHLLRLFIWLGMPVAIYVICSAIYFDPYDFSVFGSGGYQLTGLFLAVAVVCSFVLHKPAAFAIAFLGLMVTGHISGNFFVVVALLGAVIAQKIAWKNILRCAACTLIAIITYTSFVAPPLILSRIIWKASGTIVGSYSSGNTPISRLEAGQLLVSKGGFAGKLLGGAIAGMPEAAPKLDTAVNADAGDRLVIYRSAVKTFLEHPIFGAGYGAVSYDGVYTTAHNSILELAAESGLVGAMMGVFILVSALHDAWRGASVNQSRASAFALGYLVLMVATSMVSGVWGTRLLCFGFGLAMASNTLGKTCNVSKNYVGLAGARWAALPKGIRE